MQLRDAMRAYFAGEQAEMIAILVGALIAILVAAALWLRMRDGFSTGFVITSVAVALLLAGTAVSLLVRDGRMAPQLNQAISTPETAESALIREKERIDTVIRNYPIYRYVAAGLLAIAVAALLLTTRGWIHGVALGLMLFAAAQVIIDHYSQLRARRYAEALATR